MSGQAVRSSVFSKRAGEVLLPPFHSRLALSGDLLHLSIPPHQVLVLVLLATLAAKALLEGFHTLPRYCPRYGKRTLACFAAGFAVFPLPELFPSECWELCCVLRRCLLARQPLRGPLQQLEHAAAAGPGFRATASQLVLVLTIFCCSPRPSFADYYWLFHSLWHVFMAEAFHLLYLQLEGAHLQRQGSSDSDGLASQLSGGSWASAAVLLQPAQRLVRPRLRQRRQVGRSESPVQSQAGSPRMLLRSGKNLW